MKKISLIAVFCCLIGISGNVFGQEISISTAQEFYEKVTVANRTKTFKQTEDLDFSNLDDAVQEKLFARFCTDATAFTGTYDGCGHKITGLKIPLTDEIHNTIDDYGLFGDVVGTIKNLIIDGAEIGCHYQISNVSFVGDGWNKTAWPVSCSIGVIAGKVNGGLIDSCQVVNSKLTTSKTVAAGMIAGAVEGKGKVTNCVASGSIIAKHIAGGIVGKMWSDVSGNGNNVSSNNNEQYIQYCSFTGTVTANPSMFNISKSGTINTEEEISLEEYETFTNKDSIDEDGITYYFGTQTQTSVDTMFYAYAGGICGSIGNGAAKYIINIKSTRKVTNYYTKVGDKYILVADRTIDTTTFNEGREQSVATSSNNVSQTASNANFTGCYSNATVTATGYNGYAAGIINSTGSNGATVGNSYAAGTTTAENTTTVSQSSNTDNSTTNSTGNKTSSEVNGSGNNSIGDHFTDVNGEIVPSNLCAETLETVADGDITAPATWGGKYFSDKATAITIKNKVTIPSGRAVTLNDNMNLTVDGGSIIIADGGNLIDKRSNATLQGTMQKNITAGGWNFIGLAMNEDIRAFVGQPAIVALAFNYETGDWATDYLHYYTNDQSGDTVGKGNGILVYTNEGFTLESTGTLVNDDVTVTAKVKTNSETQGNWMALANPYPAAMLASNIISGIQTDNQTVQGQVVYVRESNAWKTISSSTEKVDGGHGFFVNFATTGSKTVNMQKSWTQTTIAKSTPAERNFLTVSVSTDGYKVPVMFAKNEAATAEYDIFDANKMFGDGSVAEPYLICNDKNLCKEEVNALPYTATMNIKSGEAQSVEIIAENIPEGYSLTLIDNEEEIVMNQGDVYTVNIASGENADRFKLKIGEKNVSITDIETAEALSIRNNNRNIIIEGGKNIKAEVYNTLGQKVYETTKRNFSLEGVEAGAYVVKVQSGNAVQSHKMIIR